MNEQRLDALIAGLPRDVTPPPSLWRGIERAMPRPARRYWPQALAAGVAIAALSATLTAALVTHVGRPVASQASRSEMPSAFGEPVDAAYRATRAVLRQDFETRLALLPAATRADIAKSLSTIRQAEGELRRALGEDPSSPVLERLLQATWNDELELYTDVIRNTQPAMTRTAT
jgi:hypothetical protein